jgi:hypothetical protein
MNRWPAVRVYCVVLAWAAALAHSGCGGSSASPPSLSSITVLPSAPTINWTQIQNFTATGTYSDGSQKDITLQATWTSGTTSVATMGAVGDPQQVIPSFAGTTLISATIGAVSGSTLLTVVPQGLPALASVSVTPANPSIAAGSVENFTATALFSNGTQQDVTAQASWSSSVAAVATIGTAGDPQPVNAVSAGTCTISAAFGGMSGSTVLTVTTQSGIR